jgi:pyrroloquinoline quinone (PQQ) biosynthesis protein C
LIHFQHLLPTFKDSSMHTQAQQEWLAALSHETSLLMAELDRHPGARRLFDGSIDAAGYASFLVQTYHYVRWTTPLLERAGRRMKQLRQHPELAELLLQKASEERGHERWLLADLKNLGWSAERVGRSEVCRAVAAYVAWNRFTSEAGSPTAFLGTAYVLESLATQRAQTAVERLLARRAIPHIGKALTFLRGHGEVDGGHVAELVTALRVLTQPEEQSAVLLSASTTRALYTGLFHELEPLEVPLTSGP